MRVITLLTDFGTRDPYVGIMKGVILSINPEATIIDISHEIQAQDIREAAFMVKEYYAFFPAATIHVAVVDPTVGSDRRGLLVAQDGHFFIGPDNGIFSLVFTEGTEAHALTNREFMAETVSSTFHGRDVFAPVAAHLSKGIEPSAFGPVITDPVLLEDIFPLVTGDLLSGEIVRFDRFGNAITNIERDILAGFTEGIPYVIECAGHAFRDLNRSYYEGEFTCLLGSSGYLEFGCFRGSFKKETGVSKGEKVFVRRVL